MNFGQAWELTVPADDRLLLAELRRHGVRPGQRLHIVVSDGPASIDADDPPAFFASYSGPVDFAERSREILDAGFPLTLPE